ncbi:hypothetical protein ALC57_04335 [Trachymyrmex cornetzi]|uniref:Uncharacterized protein n=1 Tax=Trachymyrmex cornetzi TaxID=471704 RepID=A0A151JCS1_9HYME|nr:hypothetical protein ALC57_04335 [Trachymyrmex cornetzi]
MLARPTAKSVCAYRSLGVRTVGSGNSLASAPSELWRLAALNGARCPGRSGGIGPLAPYIGQKNDRERGGMSGDLLLLQAGDAAEGEG